MKQTPTKMLTQPRRHFRRHLHLKSKAPQNHLQRTNFDNEKGTVRGKP
jgi:hypothetical protein